MDLNNDFELSSAANIIDIYEYGRLAYVIHSITSQKSLDKSVPVDILLDSAMKIEAELVVGSTVDASGRVSGRVSGSGRTEEKCHKNSEGWKPQAQTGNGLNQIREHNTARG